ncbi:MAG: tetratricopeptide repeat protein [Gemmatimonadaceae bacterium]
MTLPSSSKPRPRSDSPFDSMSEWFELYNKQITWGVVGVALVAAGIWFYSRSQSLKEEKAERALMAAQQSIPGNMPLAESDLRKLIQRYDGTSAAYQAQLALARALYDEGKYQDGIESLKNAMPKLSKSKDFESAGHLLLAAGYEQTRQFLDAASEYALAAKADRFDQDRQRHESAEARAYLEAGRTETAKQIWTRLAADSKGTVAGEARVRLGELEAKPEPKS